MIAETEKNKILWGEAVRVAAYLHNRSPTKANEQTAYEMWNGEKPNLKHLRIFECVAYAKNLGQLKKLDNRSKMVKFVGYMQISIMGSSKKENNNFMRSLFLKNGKRVHYRRR